MSHTSTLDAILVPIDFSPGSLRALDVALAFRPTGGEVTALHVIDTELASRVDQLGLSAYADVIAKMRARADEECAWLAKDKRAAVDVLVVEGVPFVEILKIAKDLDVDLIAIGTRSTPIAMQELLFGGTAEKVLRAAPCPVLCVP
jgi:nucleotide-binding universal stress UspA family protein